MGDSLDSSNLDQNSDDHSTSIIEANTFLSYLRKVIIVLLQEEGEDLNAALNTAFEDRTHLECIKKFLSDSQVSSLFIQKGSNKGKYTLRVISCVNR